MMIFDNIKFHVESPLWRGSLIIYAKQRLGKSTYFAQPLEFKLDETADNEMPNVQPFIEMTIEDATNLMDELWHSGIRPTSGIGSVGQLSATERHLEDMRKLVFDRKE